MYRQQTCLSQVEALYTMSSLPLLSLPACLPDDDMLMSARQLATLPIVRIPLTAQYTYQILCVIEKG
jgi:hypothetical protein